MRNNKAAWFLPVGFLIWFFVVSPIQQNQRDFVSIKIETEKAKKEFGHAGPNEHNRFEYMAKRFGKADGFRSVNEMEAAGFVLGLTPGEMIRIMK